MISQGTESTRHVHADASTSTLYPYSSSSPNQDLFSSLDSSSSPSPKKEKRVTGGEGESEGGTGDSASPKERAGKRPFPNEMGFTQEMREWANRKGCQDAGRQFERFKAHHLAKDTRFNNWDMAWKNWIFRGIAMKEKGHA